MNLTRLRLIIIRVLVIENYIKISNNEWVYVCALKTCGEYYTLSPLNTIMCMNHSRVSYRNKQNVFNKYVIFL